MVAVMHIVLTETSLLQGMQCVTFSGQLFKTILGNEICFKVEKKLKTETQYIASHAFTFFQFENKYKKMKILSLRII